MGPEEQHAVKNLQKICENQEEECEQKISSHHPIPADIWRFKIKEKAKG
jgi:hypothetical protein